jgi:hypothetical protein
MNNDPPNHCAPPWFLIAKEALSGTSLETLSTRYHVSIAEIQSRLDVAICQSPCGDIRVRTNAEITQASQRARNDLVSILLESIEQLHASQDSRLDQTDKLATLTQVAGRLFSWASSSTLRTVNINHAQGYQPDKSPNNAVDLSLSATSPEALRAIANQQAERENTINNT